MNGETPPETVICGRCATACDSVDNFCRGCGLALAEDRLPAVRESRLPALPSFGVPRALVKGATVLAAGAAAEWLVRRAAGRVFGRPAAVTRLPERRQKPRLVAPAEQDEGDAFVSETFLLRRVRIRR